jgi:O-antigen ligase
MVGSTEFRDGPRSIMGDAFLLALGVLLAGYVVFGRVFAGIGVAPLFVGELTLALGLFAFLFSSSALASLASAPTFLLSLLVSWTILCTVPYVGEYGFDALRDSVIIMYALFAFVVGGLLLAKPGRLWDVPVFLRVLTSIFVPVAPALLLISDRGVFGDQGEAALIHIKPGTTAVHLAAAALLALLGFRRAGVLWTLLLMVSMAIAASVNRGGMLAMIIMLAIGIAASGRLGEFRKLLLASVVLVVVAYALDVSVPTDRGRDVGVRQLADNFISIFVSGEQSLEGTKAWRMTWWKSIIDYTFNGPYFWSGKGFGVNLAIADGFLVGVNEWPNSPLLRSPHNAHLNILARMGVPGFSLWLLTLGTWAAVLVAGIVRARRRNDETWARLFLLILCYGIGLLVDASFDVTLEGPMAGIWFWSIFGTGAAATMIYRAKVTAVTPVGAPNRPEPVAGPA